MPPVMDRYLGIYLNDQLALGVAWRELARRTARNNRGTALGTAVEGVAQAIAEDVDTFGDIMKRLGVSRSPVKAPLTWLAERIGRFKPNGKLAGYSPLSRFEELEFLAMGIDGKKQLWTTLRDAAGLRTRLPDVDFEALIRRAEDQRAVLEPFRVRAGKEAFVSAGE